MLPFISNIVCDYTADVPALRESTRTPRDLTPPHVTIANDYYKKLAGKYDHVTFIESVKDILKWALLREYKNKCPSVDSKIELFLKALRKQVSEALLSCNIFRNEMSEERDIICLCIAVIVYLGYYDLE